ncbi:MAG: DUF167 domain-containing protein, partial [Verrucomicrobiota bacterium]
MDYLLSNYYNVHMKIRVKVLPNSSKKQVVQVAENEYRIYINAKPIKGEANKQVRELLCQYLNQPKHCV